MLKCDYILSLNKEETFGILFCIKFSIMKSFYAYYCNIQGKPIMVPLQLKASDKRAAFNLAYEFKQKELMMNPAIKSIKIMELDMMEIDERA